MPALALACDQVYGRYDPTELRAPLLSPAAHARASVSLNLPTHFQKLPT